MTRGKRKHGWGVDVVDLATGSSASETFSTKLDAIDYVKRTCVDDERLQVKIEDTTYRGYLGDLFSVELNMRY